MTPADLRLPWTPAVHTTRCCRCAGWRRSGTHRCAPFGIGFQGRFLISVALSRTGGLRPWPFQHRNGLIPGHRREVSKEVVEPVARFEVLHEYAYRDPRAGKHRGASQDVWIPVYRSVAHRRLCRCSWRGIPAGRPKVHQRHRRNVRPMDAPSCPWSAKRGFGAWGETRTLTGLPLPDFESGASTNFATQARSGRAGNVSAPRAGVNADAPGAVVEERPGGLGHIGPERERRSTCAIRAVCLASLRFRGHRQPAVSWPGHDLG